MFKLGAARSKTTAARNELVNLEVRRLRNGISLTLCSIGAEAQWRTAIDGLSACCTNCDCILDSYYWAYGPLLCYDSFQLLSQSIPKYINWTSQITQNAASKGVGSGASETTSVEICAL